MPKIPQVLVDADACPARADIILVCKRHGIVPEFVAAHNIPDISNSSSAKMTVSSDGFDAADDHIIASVKPGDLVLTTDLLLAQRAVKAKAAAMNFTGTWLSDSVIHDMVARREILKYLRESGASLENPARYAKENKSALKESLHLWIEKRKRLV